MLLRAIRKNERIRELAINPLMLTVIALVHRDRAKLPDHRAMVDCVMIDLDYDGEVFDIDLFDVPERMIWWRGSMSSKHRMGETTVAVRIIDMLGEEVLVTEGV